jgi:hypothetical protein
MDIIELIEWNKSVKGLSQKQNITNGCVYQCTKKKVKMFIVEFLN